MIYGGVQRAQVTDNSLVVKPNAVARAFVVVQGEGDQVPTDITIDGNTGYNEGGSVADGLATVGRVEGLRATDNRFHGFDAVGIAIGNLASFLIDRNELRGSGAEVGIRVGADAGAGRVTDNTISGTESAVDAPGTTQVDGNTGP